MAKYRHEGDEHRRILFERGSGMSPNWRNFRQFLADMGPAPADEYIVTRVMAGDLTYAPGKATWMHKDRQPVPVDLFASMEIKPVSNCGQWTTIRGKPVDYAQLASHLGVPFEVMSMALRNNQTPEELFQQASVAESLIQGGDASWLAPERRDAFFTAYRMWHMQVLPRYAAAATPAFLYLYSALPAMLKARDGLIAIELWNPPTEKGKRDRAAHPHWRRFGEVMTRVEAARAEFQIYKQYSLFTQIDDFWARLSQSELRFRTGPKAQAQQAA